MSTVVRRLAAAAILLCVPLSALPAHAAPAGRRIWTRRYMAGPQHFDTGKAIAVSPGGGSVFVAITKGEGTSRDVEVLAYSTATGSTDWSSRFDGRAHDADEPDSITVSHDGARVFVTGYSTVSQFSTDMVTIAYDAATGARVWLRRLHSAAPAALAVSPADDRVFVTGVAGSGSWQTVAYRAADGTRLWSKTYAGPDGTQDAAAAIGVAPDGTTVFVTGRILTATESWDVATIAYDAATGSVRWRSIYNDDLNGSDTGSSLDVSPDGSTLYVAGTTWTFGGYVNRILRYDAATGAPGWTAWVFTNAYEGPMLRVTPDGSKVILAGEPDPSDYAAWAFDAPTGQLLWTSTYDGPAGGNDAADAMALSGDGSRVYLTGVVAAPAPSYGEYATVGLDTATGARDWARLYDGPEVGSDVATGIAVSPTGSGVFVTGESPGPVDRSATTIAYQR